MTHAAAPIEASPICWICGEAKALPWKECTLDRPLGPEDLRITDSRYGTTLGLWKCAGCDFIFANDADVARLTDLYARLDDPAYEEGEAARALQMRALVKSAREMCPEARTLLDVGAATGLLVSEAASLGLEAEGIEPSCALAACAQERGARVHQGTLPHPALGGKHFDIVCLVDVIEHVSDPLALLREAASYLAPGGVLVLVTPDIGSFAARLLGRRWWHLRLAQVCYFNQRSIEAAFKRSSLAIRHQRRARWFFDIGYLAERMERYLPVGGLNRLIRRIPGLRAIYRLVIPLNLRDSFLFLLSHHDASPGELGVAVNGRATWAGHLAIMRFDHWFKNVFVLPGVVVALTIVGTWPPALVRRLVLGLLSVGLIASSNYVLNEVLDAARDRHHRLKRTRPVPQGLVSIPLAYAQWIGSMLCGLALGWAVSPGLTATVFALWVMGCIYNIPPVRSKDRAYVDVLSEAINNPLRLLIGWAIVGPNAVAPGSLLLSYWMIGCYFMALKRFAELRTIGSAAAAEYRLSFASYDENRLLTSIMFYAAAAMLFFGVFVMRYRLELILSFPAVALVMAVYLQIGLRADSPAQHPEELYREGRLMAATVLCAVIMVVCLVVDMPWLDRLVTPTAPTR